MATLSTTDRKKAARRFIRKAFTELDDTAMVDTTEIFDEIVNSDVWIDDNQNSYLSALSTGFKPKLTASQLTLLFNAVSTVRAGL